MSFEEQKQKEEEQLQKQEKEDLLIDEYNLLCSYISNIESLISVRQSILLESSFIDESILEKEMEALKTMKENKIVMLSKRCHHQMVKDTIDTWDTGLMDICYCSKCLLSEEVIFESKHKEELNMNM
jgi:hypothetical protein